MERSELVIIGAGPAGMAAATAAAQTGVSVMLIDGYPRPGGQYFKQPPLSFDNNRDHTARQMEARHMLAALDREKIRVLSDTTVWYIFPAETEGEWVVALAGPGDTPSTVQTPSIILATGAYDRPVAFPGWTLPGVMTAGAAQILIKAQRVLPGRRVLLSGTGPLPLAVAAQLVWAGAEVVALLEGSTPSANSLRYGAAMWGQWDRLREGWDYWQALRGGNVPIRVGWSVIEARGENQVEEAVIARLDADWRPIPGSEQTVPVDTLIIGYGFLPSTELGRLMGADHYFDPAWHSYVPRRDSEMQTSLPGVYAVGDGAGVGGAELARLEGEVAGLAAARDLGHLSEGRAWQAIAARQPALTREYRFARMLNALFTPGPGLYSLADDETVICRCEEVTQGEIMEAIAQDCHSVTWIKRLTRAGMGFCQGRICGRLVAQLAAQRLQQAPETIPPDTIRPPVKPIPVEMLEGNS